MKKYLGISLAAIIMLSACKGNKTDNTKTQAQNPTTKALINRFAPIIQGVWVKVDYLDKIIRSKSPVASRDLAWGITTLIIDTQSIDGDSLLAGASFNNHEGGSVVIKFKSGKSISSICAGKGDLSFNIANGDTTLIYIEQNADTHKNIVSKYRRALIKPRSADDDAAYGLDYLVNKALFAGNYVYNNSAGQQPIVTFTNDFRVKGLEGFKTFLPLIDMSTGPMNNLDNIIFDETGDNSKTFIFKIDADTLKLYNMYANADSSKQVLGPLKYKLVKKK